MKYEILEEFAGVDELIHALESTQTPFHDEDFELLLLTVLNIQGAKRNQYGDYIEAREKSEDIAIFENFVDIKRKYVRLSIAVTKEYSFKDLCEGYLDLAVYGLLGLQLLFHIQERRNVSEPDRPTRPSGE